MYAVIHILYLYYKNISMPTLEKTLNVRLPQAMHTRLSALTESTGRSKSYLAIEALEAYLDQQAWQIQDIEDAIKEADRGDFAPEEEVNKLFAKYDC